MEHAYQSARQTTPGASFRLAVVAILMSHPDVAAAQLYVKDGSDQKGLACPSANVESWHATVVDRIDANSGTWAHEAGQDVLCWSPVTTGPDTYTIRVGGSSLDLPLHGAHKFFCDPVDLRVFKALCGLDQSGQANLSQGQVLGRTEQTDYQTISGQVDNLNGEISKLQSANAHLQCEVDHLKKQDPSLCP